MFQRSLQKICQSQSGANFSHFEIYFWVIAIQILHHLKLWYDIFYNTLCSCSTKYPEKMRIIITVFGIVWLFSNSELKCIHSHCAACNTKWRTFVLSRSNDKCEAISEWTEQSMQLCGARLIMCFFLLLLRFLLWFSLTLLCSFWGVCIKKLCSSGSSHWWSLKKTYFAKHCHQKQWRPRSEQRMSLKMYQIFTDLP